MKETVKKINKKYYKPTPTKWRKIGDSCLDISIIGGAVVALCAAPPAWIPVAIMAIGRIGKIITNFTTEK